MLKKIFNWFLSLFRSRFNDSLSGFTPKSSVKRGSETKPVVPKLVIPRSQKPCKWCHNPMFVSIGQIAYTHRSCRGSYRHQRLKLA